VVRASVPLSGSGASLGVFWSTGFRQSYLCRAIESVATALFIPSSGTYVLTR
jgi:hypothetical protein